jgi:hypothetical protein
MKGETTCGSAPGNAVRRSCGMLAIGIKFGSGTRCSGCCRSSPMLIGRFSAAILAVVFLLQPLLVRAETLVDLELIIAVDVSRSIDMEEAQLQRDGYVTAFFDKEVIQAVKSGFFGKVAVLYIEWAGGFTKVAVDWTVIEDEASATAFSKNLRRQELEFHRRTSISDALDFSVPLFEGNGYKGRRKVIDVSGDGPNNSGRLVNVARDDAVAAGITINGLPILSPEGDYGSSQWLADLDLYYESCVIGGRGAFMVAANGFQDFSAAIRRKLVLEISGNQPDQYDVRRSRLGSIELAMAGYLLAQGTVVAEARVAPSCDIGERRRRRYYYDP